MAKERRAVIFGRNATAYEASRPSYPDAAIEHIGDLVEASHAVEVGAGTGKATESIARPGLNLTCLEPSPQMAELLEAKRLPGVTVVVSSFEEWDGTQESSELIYSAQAWHWVDTDTGFAKALSVLRPGGVLALMWNIPLDRYSRHQGAYQRHAPQLLADHDERVKRRDTEDWCDELRRAGFVATHRFTHRWEQELTSDRYRDLYSTYSDHMMLDEPDRTRLLDALAGDVEQWGGTATLEYRTEVFSGRKPDTDRQ